MCCDTPSRRTCWITARTCARCRPCWATRTSAPRRSTPMFTRRGSGRCTKRCTRAQAVEAIMGAEFPKMPTKKITKAAEAEETKPKKTAVKKAVKEKAEAEPKPKAAKKAKTVEPEVAAEPVIESKKVAAKKPAK